MINQFNNLKDLLSNNSKTNVVYQLSCDNCQNTYIGETRKLLSERVNQHAAAVNNKNKLSLIYKHCHGNNHLINLNNPKILIHNNNVRARRFLESFFTSYHRSTINRSIEFSEIYVPTIKKCID